MSTMPIKVAYQVRPPPTFSIPSFATTHSTRWTQKSVVGIRYAVKGCWRRFQIKFHTPDDAQSFIDSIQHICPCKDTSASTSSSRAPLTSSQLLPQQQTQTQMRTSGGSGSSSPSRPQPSQRRKRQPSFSDLESLMMPPPPPRRPAASAAAAHMRFEAGSQRPSSSSSASPSRPSTTDRRSEVSRTTFRPSPLFSQAAAGDSSADHEEDDDDDVRASQPTRSKRPRRSSSQHRDHADGRATLLQQADLVEAMRTAAPSALYDGSLGDQQLEAMIEDIVCEDGFVELCTKVQRMWRARVIGAARPSASSPLQQHAPS